MIKTRQEDDGQWLAMTDCSPWMCVEADTEIIAISIVERALVWHKEKLEAREIERLSVIDQIRSVLEFQREEAENPSTEYKLDHGIDVHYHK